MTPTEWSVSVDEFLAAISAVGFPIVVTFYLLFQLRKTIDKFTQELDRLITIVERIEMKQY